MIFFREWGQTEKRHEHCTTGAHAFGIMGGEKESEHREGTTCEDAGELKWKSILGTKRGSVSKGWDWAAAPRDSNQKTENWPSDLGDGGYQ